MCKSDQRTLARSPIAVSRRSREGLSSIESLICSEETKATVQPGFKHLYSQWRVVSYISREQMDNGAMVHRKSVILMDYDFTFQGYTCPLQRFFGAAQTSSFRYFVDKLITFSNFLILVNLLVRFPEH